MKHNALILTSIMALSACSSVNDGQTQHVTVRTPGAENAKCFLENQDFKYVAYSNETVEVMKSPHDMTVNCMAPGNRNKSIVVPRTIEKSAGQNAANGFLPGLTYDYLSRGIYDYPDEVVVSFSGVQAKSYGLPQHQSSDLAMDGSPQLESMGTSEALVPETYGYSTLQKRGYGDSQRGELYNSAPNTMDIPPVSQSYYDPTEEDK